MQDTSPPASQRPEPIPGREADDVVRADVTWFEDLGERPADTPVIALIPLPDTP